MSALPTAHLFLRCLRQDGLVVYTEDGPGDPYTYRLVALPDDAYGSG